MKLTATQLRRIIKEEAATADSMQHISDALESLEQAVLHAPAALVGKIKAAMASLSSVMSVDNTHPGNEEFNVMKDNFLEGKLRKIVKEEARKVLLEYEQSVVRRGPDLYLVDDDGNEEYLEPVAGSDYEHLHDGDSELYSTGTGYGGGYGGNYGRSPRY